MEAPRPWTPPTDPRPRFDAGRLTLRFYRVEDAAAYHAAINESRATLLPWLAWAVGQYETIEQVTAFMQATSSGYAPDRFDPVRGYLVGMFETASGQFLGGTGLNRIDLATSTAEVGYWVRQSRRREGWCTDALRAMLTWAFRAQEAGGFGFRRVHLFAARSNVASAGVPRRLGLHQSTHARQQRWVHGIGWDDTMGWDVLASEWNENGPAMGRAV